MGLRKFFKQLKWPSTYSSKVIVRCHA